MMRWNSTKTYTEEDIIRMQQEAVNRVHEFQNRAREYSYYDMPTIGEPPVSPAPIIEAESHVVEPETSEQAHIQAQQMPIQQSVPSNDPIKGILERFNLDNETLLILGLIFVLYNEKADNVLLMALAYLLL